MLKTRDAAAIKQLHDQSVQRLGTFRCCTLDRPCVVLGIKKDGFAITVDRKSEMTSPVDLVDDPVCNMAHRNRKALSVLLYEKAPVIIEESTGVLLVFLACVGNIVESTQNFEPKEIELNLVSFSLH